MNLIQKLKLCWRILTSSTSSLELHAEEEMRHLGESDDEMQKLMNRQLKEVITVIGTHGHSGFSIQYMMNVLEKLVNYEVITPLTGEDHEWSQVSFGDDLSEDLYQNIRYPCLFKDGTGRAWDINAYVFCYPDGVCYTSSDSVKWDIEFPYTPKVEYIDVDEEGNQVQEKE